MPKANIVNATGKAKAAFHVVIAYEDFAASQHAMDACKLLVSQLDGGVEFRSGMWKFDILRNAKLNQIAADDAAGADAIIVATSHSAELPAEVKQWIETWIPLKKGQTCILLALLGGTDEGADEGWTVHEYLRHAAASAQIDFLPQALSGRGFAGSLDVNPPLKSVKWSDRVVSRPAPEGWGLND